MGVLDVSKAYQLYKANHSNVGLPNDLRPWQMKAMKALSENKNVLAIHPTGSGKSLIFTLLPVLMDQVDTSQRHIALVISPLRSLMYDQAREMKALDISCLPIFRRSEMDPSDIESIQKGDVSIILTSPEAAVEDFWLSCFKGLREKLCVVCCDEVHCIPLWGSTFRESYMKLDILRSNLAGLPWLGLTATCDQTMRKDIETSLGINDFILQGELPDRPNIFLEVADRGRAFHQQLGWLVAELREKGESCPKTLIYSTSINKVAKLHEWFVASLKDRAWTDKTGERVFANRLVCQYHKSVGPDQEGLILDTFPKADTTLRVLICTVAFGMGINIGDVQNVIHWGMSDSIAHYWQEVGRCARKIPQGRAIIYPTRLEKENPVAQMVKSYLAQPKCLRNEILNAFVQPGIDLSALACPKEECALLCQSCSCSSCLCCSHCKSLCPCTNA